ncbi:MAG: CPBP family intramembrane metalloprotease [Roseivirga sp.]|nr:CPBP family intramembrane metalloprotease [Roseivirga sp.]
MQPLKILFAFLPTTAAFVITYISEGEKGTRKLWGKTFLKKNRIKYYGIGLLGILLVGWLSMVIRFTYDEHWPLSSDFPDLSNSLVLAPFLLLFPGFTEEFGWRGFLQEKVQVRRGVFLASLITGVIWGGWHSMDFLMGNYPADTFTVLVFLAYIIATSIVIGNIYKWSGGSIFVAILAHFSANMVNSFLPIWNEEAGMTTPLIFVGLLWLLSVILLAIELFQKRRTS